MVAIGASLLSSGCREPIGERVLEGAEGGDAAGHQHLVVDD